MSVSNEYKGEKITGKLTARMVPPNNNYPDCVCEVVMTEQHVYVLEDNFDGTYETHFTFPMRQITSIEVKREERDDLDNPYFSSMVTEIISRVFAAIGGLVVLPGQGGRRKTEFFLVITYMDGMGRNEKLFFRDLPFGTKKFRQAFKKASAAYSI